MGLGERTYLQIICVPRREQPGSGITTVMVIVNDITVMVNKRQDVEQARTRADDACSDSAASWRSSARQTASY
jgi:hypothetical protein